MLSFRILVVQMTVSLVMSALAGLLLQGRWKAGILIIVAAAAGIVLLSLAIVIAELISRRWRLGERVSDHRKRR